MSCKYHVLSSPEHARAGRASCSPAAGIQAKRLASFRRTWLLGDASLSQLEVLCMALRSARPPRVPPKRQGKSRHFDIMETPEPSRACWRTDRLLAYPYAIADIAGVTG